MGLSLPPLALSQLNALALACTGEEIASDCVLLEDCTDPAMVAKLLSTHLGGQWWPSLSGVTWLRGSSACWFVRREFLGPIVDCREAIASLGLVCGWSSGSAARALLKYVAVNQAFSGSASLLSEGVEYAYHDCAPGVYALLRQWDIEACYYSLASRLPSLRCHPLPGEILWGGLSAAEWGRWREVLAVCKSVKLLRNSLVGCMRGGTAPGLCYIKGEARYLRRPAGPLAAAAALIIRTAWELCREAAVESDSVYSQTDCVATRDAVAPRSWESLGLTCRLQAIGSADICARGIYRIGDKCTVWYDEGSRFHVKHLRPEPPPIFFRPMWI